MAEESTFLRRKGDDAMKQKRTKKQWYQLVGAYGVLYAFFAGWMALHMGVYMSTVPDECEHSNGGNVCVGESRFDNFRSVALNSVLDSVPLTCRGDRCTSKVEIRLNRDVRFFELTGPVEITCGLTSARHDVASQDYTFSDCTIPESDIELVVTSASPPGVLNNRSCSTTDKTVVMTYEQGARLPFAHSFTLDMSQRDVNDAPLDHVLECRVSQQNHRHRVKQDSLDLDVKMA